MKKWCAVASVFVAACAAPHEKTADLASAIVGDLSSFDFVGVPVMALPAEFVGTWTGNLGPTLSTFRLEADGTGVLCGANTQGTYSVSKVKFDGAQLRTQQGLRFELVAVDGMSIRVRMPYFATDPASRFYLDSNLEKAASDCAKGL